MRKYKPLISQLKILSIIGLSAMSIFTTQAQIYITNNGNVEEYSTTGTLINNQFVHQSPISMAAEGSNLFFGNANDDSISEYTTSGATVNNPLITGVGVPFGLAVSNSDLYAINFANPSTVGKYTTTGNIENADFISENNYIVIDGIAISGSDIFLACANGYQGIQEYTTSGTLVNSSLVTVPGSLLAGIAVSGADIFVSDVVHGTIGEYTTSGATVNSSLITGLNNAYDMTIVGSDLYVVNNGSGTVGEYTTNGTVINSNLITGLFNPYGIVVIEAPEPSINRMFFTGIIFLILAFKFFPNSIRCR